MMKWKLFGKKRRAYKKNRQQAQKKIYTPEEKLKLINEFQKIGGPAQMFAKWYGVNYTTFTGWMERYKAEGEAGLENKTRGVEVVPEAVKTEIIKLKQENPEFGVRKISDLLKRNKFVTVYTRKIMDILRGDPSTADLIAKKQTVFGNSGKEPVHFERSKPRQLYQMDIMTFMLKGLYRVYIIACLDDYSRYVASIGLFRRQTSEKAVDVLRKAIENFGTPEEVLTDNGRQFYTWRGKSQFNKFVTKSGIQHIRSRPYHPQTLGKIESLWRNMYQELFSNVALGSFEEAEKKIDEWITWYNFKRPHQGIGGLTPADRFFGTEKGVREIMEKGSAMVKDALMIDPRRIKEPVYLIGKINGKEIRIIAKEGNVTLEGLDGVEEKAVESVKKEEITEAGGENGGEKTGPGGVGEPLRTGSDEGHEGPDGGGETQDHHDGPEENKDTAGSEPGNGSEPGISAEMEEQSN
jgi:transposase InsO family protein